MTENIKPETFRDGDRVSHKKRGLGTVNTHPETTDVVVSAHEASKDGPGQAFVVWDDDRFPVGNVPHSELEKVPEAAAAISTGF